MPPRLRPAVDALLARSPAQGLFRRRAAGRLTVLAYHCVDDGDRFAAQLDELLASGHNPLTLDDTLAALAGQRTLPRRALLVSFDDGDRSILEAGLPALRARGVPAVAFVVAGLVDGTRPPWWVEAEAWLASGGRSPLLEGQEAPAAARLLKKLPDAVRRQALEELRQTATASCPPVPQLTSAELQQLTSGGVAVGNHTWSHPCLPRCDDAVLRDEVVRAHERLTAILGAPPRAFAYPNGDYDPRAAGLLAELGYGAAFLFDHRHARPRGGDRFRVSRLRVAATTSRDRFRIILSGLHPALHRLAGRR
ncbi:MAG TPA: polysaccharide deacetylase family protein [Thermoanaerobaculia bacterium]|nr:polysaccharide deacetylase family protein [Thermoanaerobaculia bacterium]